jgi:hypothetical protein
MTVRSAPQPPILGEPERERVGFAAGEGRSAVKSFDHQLLLFGDSETIEL